MDEEQKNLFLSYVNGDMAVEKAPLNLLNSARQYLKENPLPEVISGISENQALVFSFLHNEFIKSYPVIVNHECWHAEFGSGGTTGSGSGEEFLIFHRQMMKDLKHFIGSDHLPIWEPGISTDFVANVFPLPNGTFLSPFPFQEASITLTIPSFLTVEGGDQELVFKGKEIRSLADIETMDDLGRIIGMNYHGTGHQLLGGTMGGFASPLVAHFYAWHGEVDKIIDQWEQTEIGQEWFQGRDSEEWQKAEEFFDEEFYAQGKNFTTYCNMTDIAGWKLPSSNNHNNRLSDGAIAGIVVGTTAFTAAAVFAAVFAKKLFLRSTHVVPVNSEREDNYLEQQLPELDNANNNSIEMVEQQTSTREKPSASTKASDNHVFSFAYTQGKGGQEKV